MTTKEKILQYIDYKGISKRDFYRQTGLSNGFLDSGKHIGSDNLKIIISNYPEISLEWLVMDSGEMLVDNKKPNVQKKYPNHLGTSLGTQLGINEMCKKSTQTKEEKTKSAEKVNKKNVDLNVDQNVTKPNVQKKSTNEEVSEIEKGVKLYKSKAIEESEGIPLIPIEAMAGFGSGEVQVMDYETSNYKVPEFTELKANFMIRVKGSSMYPKYSSGDLVACKKLYLSDIFFQWNKVYVLDTAQGAIIKRVKKGSDKEHLLLISENPNYDPFELHMSQINAIALVVGVIRLE
ncbi:S24 family peptidase [Ornithobacterium rhinotracheale]|uniref:S24 family peptidase n=1 Tax=Ornithobacterium rhinotracheale TaxID=28251 RepID=UPI001FF58693|nr:S24 family peptidase [Ornithobacterium rhinotracheale]MCK0199197.1 hypothetical protein [Ornithobacterium rhinotracheale]MCK0200289.1 hypothetical protein [Ornithobacterium rhinotracheale]